MTRHEGQVEKGWGHELIFATNDLYCGKLLKFNKGSKFSMHFHAEKDESWFVLKGVFRVLFIETSDATIHETILKEGSVWRNRPLQPHQVECVEEGIIIEVSTPDSVEDNYRIIPGDSQNAPVQSARSTTSSFD